MKCEVNWSYFMERQYGRRKRCDSDIHLRKMIRWNTEHFHNVYRLQSSVLSCKYFLHNILSLSLSLSSNHYSFSTDLFAGSQYTWKLLFIFLTPDSSPLRIKIFARKCFTNNHCLHCLPNYIKIYSLLYGLFCNFFISNHHVLSLSHIKPLFM